MDESELQMRFPHMRPIQRVPWLGGIAGFGIDLYGSRSFDEETRTCVQTRCICLLGIPVIAIDSYREIAAYFAPFDPTSRRMMEEILAAEEEHADDLADLLRELPENLKH